MVMKEKDQKSTIAQMEAEAEKAEKTLLMNLLGKSRQIKRQFCRRIKCPWSEYQRLEKKWSRGLERLERERKRERSI